jgi:hypothetical protein
VPVTHIDSKQAEVSGKLSQVPIGNETENVASLKAKVREGRTHRRDREDLERRIRVQLKGKIDRLFVYNDEVYLGMRHPARFDHVFNRRFVIQRPSDRATSFRPIKKQNQVVVKS